MSDPIPLSNAELRLLVNKCFEADCLKPRHGGSRWCKAHCKERPVLRRRFRQLNLDKFKASKLVRDIEARNREAL